MNLAALLSFLPLIAGAFLAYHLVFKQDLPSKGIIAMLTYIFGIIIVFFAVSWLISSFFATWATNLLEAGTQSPEWGEFIDASGNVVDSAFNGDNEQAAPEPTQVRVQVEIVVTATPIPGTNFGTQNRTGPVQHTVMAGETLTKLSQIYGVSVNDIMRANGLLSADFIQQGQVLIIPAPSP